MASTLVNLINQPIQPKNPETLIPNISGNRTTPFLIKDLVNASNVRPNELMEEEYLDEEKETSENRCENGVENYGEEVEQMEDGEGDEVVEEELDEEGEVQEEDETKEGEDKKHVERTEDEDELDQRAENENGEMKR